MTLRPREFDNIADAITLAEETKSRIYSHNGNQNSKSGNNHNKGNKNIICNYCKKPNHIEKDCRSKIADAAKNRENTQNSGNNTQNDSRNKSQGSSQDNSQRRPPSGNPNPNYYGKNYNPNYQHNNANNSGNKGQNSGNSSGSVKTLTAEPNDSGSGLSQELENQTNSCVQMN